MSDWYAVAILMSFAVLLPAALYLVTIGFHWLAGTRYGLRVLHGSLFVAFATMGIGHLLAPDGRLFSAAVAFFGAFNSALVYVLVMRQHEREARRQGAQPHLDR